MKFLSSFIRRWMACFSRSEHSKSPKRPTKDQLGAEGEKHAEKFLKTHGYQIIARNVQFSLGEMDLIAQVDKTIVFIEVKTRHSADYCHPREVIDKKKRRKIKLMALQYYRNKKYAARGYIIRFDIITLVWPQGEQPKIEHFVDAFR